MKKQSTTEDAPSRIVWDNLEEWTRKKVQEFIQSLLEVVIGSLSDGRKTVLAVAPGYRESIDSWSGVLRSLKERGMNCRVWL